jgi:hypothetical protein
MTKLRLNLKLKVDMKLIILLFTIHYSLFTINCFSQNGISVNTTGAQADKSAMLDVSGTDRGTLIPCMTTIQRNNIVSPAESLLIFNTTTNCFESYINGFWNAISCPSPCIKPVAPVAIAATNLECTSFTANWTAGVTGPVTYFLDVATDAGFNSFVQGYQNRIVGNVTSFAVTGLSKSISYYYRVRGVSASCRSDNSNYIPAFTSPGPTESGSTSICYTDGTANISFSWSSPCLAVSYAWSFNSSDIPPSTNAHYTTATSTGTISVDGTLGAINQHSDYTIYVWAIDVNGYISSPGTIAFHSAGLDSDYDYSSMDQYLSTASGLTINWAWAPPPGATWFSYEGVNWNCGTSDGYPEHIGTTTGTSVSITYNDCYSLYELCINAHDDCGNSYQTQINLPNGQSLSSCICDPNGQSCCDNSSCCSDTQYGTYDECACTGNPCVCNPCSCDQCCNSGYDPCICYGPGTCECNNGCTNGCAYDGDGNFIGCN